MRSTTIIIFLVFLTSGVAFGQQTSKMKNRLQQLFEKGEYEKCLKKATRYQLKKPHSEVPKYYISKVHWHEYLSDSLSGRVAFAHLTNAVRYSDRLPRDYNNYKNQVRQSLKNYVLDNHDSTRLSVVNQKALSFYIRIYRDTLDIYPYYFPSCGPVIQHLPLLFQSKSDSLRYELVNFAQQLEGVKYRYAGENPEAGFDCSGFTKYAYGHIGVDLPHNAHLQSKVEGENRSLEEAKVGDLVFFGSGSGSKYYTQHTGIIYSVDHEEIKVIHCVSGGVSIDGNHSSFDMYWKDKVLFVKSLDLFLDNK